MEYRLCGGTFFVLIKQACQDGSLDISIMADLIRLFRPDFEENKNTKSFTTYTSEYINCWSNSVLGKESLRNVYLRTFNNEYYSEDYRDCLARAETFVRNYISNERKSKWLICALIELIDKDTHISDDTRFIVNSNRSSVTKRELLVQEYFYLPSFILSIWHYILNNCSDNTVGRSTFLHWHKAKRDDNSRSVFVSSIGSTPKEISLAPVNESSKGITTKTSTIGSVSASTEPLDPYFLAAYNKYRRIKTLLYFEQPQEFSSFYVCNNIHMNSRPGFPLSHDHIIKYANIDKLATLSKYIIIKGTGGIGKTMMMRHLLLDALKNPYGTIPLFIPIKLFNPREKTLMDFIYDLYHDLQGIMDTDTFTKYLSDGRFTFLFDGLDEIKADYLKYFEISLEKLVNMFPKNNYIMSSRPYEKFISYSKFSVVDLQPFSFNQAAELIDKLDFRPDEPLIKQNFRSELSKLYKSHRDFCENPLLLTIMLLTYEQFAEIPSKMHLFYREAYQALAIRHDASKGAYKRSFRTGLNTDQFAHLFAEFCSRTYTDEKYEFTHDEMSYYFSRLNPIREKTYSISVTDFEYDLVNNICLMYYEDGHFYFTHRSFQEYFCASYFSQQKDVKLSSLVDLLPNPVYSNSAQTTFAMLYDIIPSRIEEYVFLPFLNKMFSNADFVYEEYLTQFYNHLYYSEGYVNYLDYENKGYSSSLMLTRLCSFLHCLHDPYDKLIPPCNDFLYSEYCFFDPKKATKDDQSIELHRVVLKTDYRKIALRQSISDSYITLNGEPERSGYVYRVDTKELFNNREKYSTIIKAIENASFPLNCEYLSVLDYYKYLRNKYCTRTSSASIFDDLD